MVSKYNLIILVMKLLLTYTSIPFQVPSSHDIILDPHVGKEKELQHFVSRWNLRRNLTQTLVFSPLGHGVEVQVGANTLIPSPQQPFPNRSMHDHAFTHALCVLSNS